MNKFTLSLLVALNLLNLASTTVLAQDTQNILKLKLADFRAKAGVYQVENPLEATGIVGTATGFTVGSITYGVAQFLKTRPKGLAGLATTTGILAGSLAAIKFSGDSLAHLRSLQITELQEIKTKAWDISTGLSDLIREHSLVKNVIDKVHNLAGKNQALVHRELQSSKELADLVAKTSSTVDQGGTDLTKKALELESILGVHLDAGHKKQLARTTHELTLAHQLQQADLHARELKDQR